MEQIAHLLGVLALLLVAARVAGHAAKRLGLPSVLGELCLGIALGPSFLAKAHEGTVVWQFLAELGVLLLLFEVGLESQLSELRKVGRQSLAVALLGIALPVLLGTGASWFLGAVRSVPGALYIGAALSATSVGITARVLRELGQSQTREARIILGAAVIDDILGLVLLALVSALAQTNLAQLDWASLLGTVLKAAAFLLLAVGAGKFLLPRLFRWAAVALGEGSALTAGLVICLAYSWGAHFFGLAPAVGAFFAGLMIQPETYAPLRASEEGALEDHLQALSLVFVPLFFVLTGMKVELSALASLSTVLFTLVLVVAGVIGKVAAGWGAGKEASPWVVGVGMVPRGEVGLIFAALGAGMVSEGQPLLPPAAFASVVAAVAATTVVAPLWLGFLLRGKK